MFWHYFDDTVNDILKYNVPVSPEHYAPAAVKQWYEPILAFPTLDFFTYMFYFMLDFTSWWFLVYWFMIITWVGYVYYILSELPRVVTYIFVSLFSAALLYNGGRGYHHIIPDLHIYAIYVLFFVIACGLLYWFYNLSKKHELRSVFDCIVLGLLFLLFSFFLILSQNLILTFVSIAGINIIIYTLLGYIRTAAASEAAAKYWALGVAAMAFFLLGSFLLFCEYGSCDYSVIMGHVVRGEPTDVAYVGLLFILLTFFFKLGFFPLSNWVADVYEGSSVLVLCLLILSKFSLMVAFKNIFPFIFGITSFEILIYVAVAATAFVGAFGAVLTQKFRRFLAYSGMVHLALVLSMFLAPVGLNLFYILAYTLFYCFSSVAVVLLGYRSSRSAGVSGLVYVTDLGHGQGASPFFFFPVIILIFNFAGLPPTLGFFLKMAVFFILAYTSSVLSTALLLFLLILTLITTFNYLRILKVTFLEKWWVDNTTYNLSHKILKFSDKFVPDSEKLPTVKLILSEFSDKPATEFLVMFLVTLIYIIIPVVVYCYC